MELWVRKKMLRLSALPMSPLHGTNVTLNSETTKFNSNTNANVGDLKVGEVPGNGNDDNSCGGIDMSDDVRRLCNEGRLKNALRILYFMVQRGIRPDSSTYASLLQECANQKSLLEGKLIHAHMIDTGFNPQIFLRTKLVIMYAKCGSLQDARRSLDEMTKRNVVSWTAIIAAYARHGHNEEALTLYNQMRSDGIQPNQFTFASVLPACANSSALELGKEIHEDINRCGFQSDVFVGSALVDMYAKCGSMDHARQVFDEMSERNVVSWNALIAGYIQNCSVNEALKLFQKMPERDVISWNAMIAGYAQTEHVDDAMKLFERMPKQDVVSWNAMIAGYVRNGQSDEALKLFRQMQLMGVKPDSVTFLSVLPGCANLAALKNGKEVHENIIRSGFRSHISVGSTLIDMYAKCGTIEYARRVFDKMSERDMVSWNAMIAAYAKHGYGKEALQVFVHMQHSGTKPDRVTFIAVLSACSHAGLLDDGWQYFHLMRQNYQVTPGVEHYCCMVDLLGRAGRLEEAQNFINNMPVKPNAAVWGSLLGACRIHTNIKLGERVAERLLELDPENDACYVSLSNIYAAAGRWADAERVRNMMKDRRVKKVPGCSWIEVNNKVHSFLIGDRSHPQTLEIYAELERLSGQMKEAGYLPVTNLVLHDVEEEQKEHILCHHSEKLAIAFGLIHAFPGTPIRIVKNLRMCSDCHTASKFISKIVVREIIVRDANRFHHFKDGQCSCGDYW